MYYNGTSSFLNMHGIDCGEGFEVGRVGEQGGYITVSLDLRNLFRRAFPTAEPVRELDPASDCVGPISIDGKISRAEVQAFWSGWSTVLLHSSDVVLAMSSLVSSGLKEGEVISGANSIRFHAPMNNALDVQLQITDDPQVIQPFAQSTTKLCLTASLQTSLGRTILIQGNDTSNPITRNRRWSNGLPAKMRGIHQLCQSPFSVDGLDFSRSFDKIPGVMMLPTDSTFVLSTVMDVFMNLVVQAHKLGIVQSAGVGVLGGCENLQLPSPEELLLGGTVYMSIGAKEQKELRNGRLLPIDFHMRNTDLKKVAGGRMNFAYVSEF